MFAYCLTSASLCCLLHDGFPGELIYLQQPRNSHIRELSKNSSWWGLGALFDLTSPVAPCSSPGGQSSQTLPPSRLLDPPVEAATPGQSSSGPLCREPTAPPGQSDTLLNAPIG